MTFFFFFWELEFTSLSFLLSPGVAKGFILVPGCSQASLQKQAPNEGLSSFLALSQGLWNSGEIGG